MAKKPVLSNMKDYSSQNEKVEVLSSDKMNRKRIDRIKSWVTFYRKNPSFFVEHYMGVTLFFYQRVWINLIARSTQFIGICSRASGKSWLIAVYSIARCILYPGTRIALASSTKAQAGLIISQHCQQLYDEYPNITRETVSVISNQNKWEMNFRNGSKIFVVISGDGGRGYRSHITVLEERRLIPNDVIDSIIRPFLIARWAPYMTKPEYEKIEELTEEPQEIIITSAYYKSHEWWPETRKFLKDMANGDPDIKGIFVDYLVSIRHGIKTKKTIMKDKQKFDPISFLMEYGNIPYGSSSNAMYKMSMFNRNVKRNWRPITDEVYASGKRNIYDIPKLSEEIRVMAVDVALRAGKENDNTVIMCARLLPSRKGWKTEITYIETHSGKHTDIQAKRIKQIYDEFGADAIVLDAMTVGMGMFDALCQVTKDEARGIEYPPFTVMDSDAISDDIYKDMKNRTLGQDAIPCVFPIRGSAQLNSTIAVVFRERLKKGLISFLVDDNTEEEFLIKSGNKDILDQEDTERRAYLLQSNVQTTLLINECMLLEAKPMNGLIKLEEPAGARKDRFSACSYLNYYVSLLDADLLREQRNGTDEGDFLGVALVL